MVFCMESGYRANYIILILKPRKKFVLPLSCMTSKPASIHDIIRHVPDKTRGRYGRYKKIYSRHRYRSLLRVLFMDPELSSTRRTDWSFGDKRYVFSRSFIARPTTSSSRIPLYVEHLACHMTSLGTDAG